MIVLALSLVAFLTVPLAGGRLARLADVEVRRPWLVFAALGLQVLFFTVMPTRLDALQVPVHFGTYALAAWFLWENRRLPGLVLIAVGAALNLAAIAANGGVMPASPDALRAAGMPFDKGEAFANSAAVAEPRLAPLGDVFAIPASWPLSNVFSIGDALIVVGVFAGLHVIGRSRLVPAAGSDWALLLHEPRFVRTWAAYAVSSVGDFAFALALGVAVVAGDGGIAQYAAVLAVQAGAAALTGIFGGGLVDRHPRRTVMLATDAVRAVAVATLVLVPGELHLGHVLAVAAVLGAGGGLFGPALQASLPDLVPSSRLVAANALVNVTFNLAVLVGPVLGGALAATIGTRAVFALDAGTFVLSGALVLLAGLPRTVAVAPAEPRGRTRALEGLRALGGLPVVRLVSAVGAVAMLGAALRQPVEPAFVLEDLAGSAADLGLAVAAWGAGMVAGAAWTPGLDRRLPRERLVGLAIAGLAVAILGAALAPGVGALLPCFVLGGVANAVLVVAYETLLQERAPAAVRGRVIAANEGLLDAVLLVGLAVGGLAAAAVGPRALYAASGLVLALGAALALLRLRPPQVRLAAADVEGVPAGRHVLVRVSGRWRAATDAPLGAVVLRVGDAEVAPLPDPGAVDAQAGRAAPRWRAAFAVPAEVLQAGPALVLRCAAGDVALPPVALRG